MILKKNRIKMKRRKNRRRRRRKTMMVKTMMSFPHLLKISLNLLSRSFSRVSHPTSIYLPL
jgi:hypothetical protein